MEHALMYLIILIGAIILNNGVGPFSNEELLSMLVNGFGMVIVQFYPKDQEDVNCGSQKDWKWRKPRGDHDNASQPSVVNKSFFILYHPYDKLFFTVNIVVIAMLLLKTLRKLFKSPTISPDLQLNIEVEKLTRLITENKQLKLQITEMEEMLRENKCESLQSVKRSLKFSDLENLEKPIVCNQLENGIILYFDNVKPFNLFIIKEGSHKNADLKPLESEFDCSFRGTIGNIAYFSTVRGKMIQFFRSAFVNDQIIFEKMRTSDISLFNNQPYYFIELATEWSVYHYSETPNDNEGEKFDLSEINHLSKYDGHMHRGILYLFRENSKAMLERVNEKIVKVEGPLIDRDVNTYYTPPHSDYIYIINTNNNVLLILNTANLTVSQMSYEPPSDSNHHAIVGIHDGILTMAFDGVWGRSLSTTKLH